MADAVARRWGVLPSADGMRWSAWPAGDKPPLPSWVPALGQAAVYGGGGSVLTNEWRNVFDAGAVGYDIFYAKKVSTDYNGRFVHPTWRTHGGIVFWGPGHSASNYNALTILTLAEATMYYEQIMTPTDWVAGLDIGNVSSECDATYGEVTGSSPLRIASGHSYGIPEVIDGYLEQYLGFALGYSNFANLLVAHKVDLTNPATAASARAWERITSTTGGAGWGSTTAPICMRYVPTQNRSYALASNGTFMRWFDRATASWVTGTGANWGYPSSDTDGGDRKTGALMYVPSRGLLVASYRQSGNLVLQYADVTTGQPAAVTATLGASLALPVAGGGAACCWCPRNNRILVFGVSGNTDKVYEVTIPATLTDPWPVATAGSLNDGITIDPLALGVWGKGCDFIEDIDAVVFTGAFSESPAHDSVTVYRPRNP